MKRIIIDGYNLLNSRSFSAPAHLDLEGQRNHLVRLLASYAGIARVSVTLVFDNSQKMASSSTQEKNVKVVFSRPGQEADDVIKAMVRRVRNPAQLTVVSSDRAIRFSAKDHGVSALTSEEFCTVMNAGNASASGNDSPAVRPSSPAAKYDTDISESEVQFWKDLFEQGDADE